MKQDGGKKEGRSCGEKERMAGVKKQMQRYGRFVPLAFMLAAVIASYFSYNAAKQSITDDLNEAMIALANENSELWTRQDTIVALRHMHETLRQPLIYQASEANFRNTALKEEAYFTLALVDNRKVLPESHNHKIASDSIILVPQQYADGMAIRVQGFANCSFAFILGVSDKTFPGLLCGLAVLSFVGMLFWRKDETEFATQAISQDDALTPAPSMLEGIKLTPMQRRLTQMLLDAPDNKVDKATLCMVLWDNKSNAEESLYTLVRRTKIALANANMEIISNRGESYQLRIIS